MKPSELPLNKRGQYAWDQLLKSLTPGQSIAIHCRQVSQATSIRCSASARARALSIPHKTRLSGTTLTILITQPTSEKPLCGTLRTDLAAAQARESNIPMRIMEARQNAAYWQRQILLRDLPDAIAQARANHAAWKMTATRLQAQLSTRQPASV